MLCDLIREFVRDDDLKPFLIPGQREAYRVFADKLERAPRYELNRQSTLMVHSLSEGRNVRMAKAATICRLPFQSMWVEFLFKDRQEWMDSAEARGSFLRIEHDQTSAPVRLGFLLERVDPEGQIITMQPAWVHKSHPDWPPGKPMVSIANMGLRFDFSAVAPIPSQEQVDRYLAQIESAKKESKFYDYYRNPDEVAAGLELESRLSRYCPPELEPFWEAVCATLSPAFTKKMLDAAEYDLLAEWKFGISLLAMLNSRNLVAIGPAVDVSKLNRNRSKAGKLSLLDYRPISIDLSRVQRNRVDGPGGSRDLSIHKVSGHWKLRSSGLYWWSDFVRGSSGRLPAPRTYKVKASQ